MFQLDSRQRRWYRIWWYELSDEEEEGRGGKGTKLALGNAEAKVIKIAMSMDSEVAIQAFIEKAEQEQAQKESNKDLPTLTMDPTKIDLNSVTEVTMVVWAADQIANNGVAASGIQAHNDGTISVSGAAVEAFAQNFPQVGDAGSVHAALSGAQINSANTSAASASAGAATQAATHCSCCYSSCK